MRSTLILWVAPSTFMRIKMEKAVFDALIHHGTGAVR